MCLALYYAPSPMTAHASVAYIVKEVAAGAFLRSLHSYGSSAMIVVLLLHFLQTFLYGAYKGKRELLWISGCTLSLLVLGMAFTGYLLSWDQSAYSAGSVGTDIVGQVPIIGEKLRLLLRGGARMGALTLSRFYVLHILIIPGLIFSFIAVHIVLFRKAGAAGPTNEDPVRPQQPAEMFYPRQVLIDMGFVLVVMGVLGMLAHFVPVTLGPEADPTNTRYLPRPEWYYLPMFQWLKYWEGWRTVIGVFIIPVILIGLVFLLPFIDRGTERRPWRRPIPVGGVLIILVGVLWLGMMSRLDDSRDPTVAAQLAQQNRVEDVDFYTAFRPYSAPSAPEGVASLSLDATAAQGKGIFDSHGCSGCHGESGGGAVGPALTHVSSHYPPAQLAAILNAPTPTMKAAGMVPLTLDSDEMKGLVAYLSSLGGGSAASAEAPPDSMSTSPAPAEAESGAAAGVSKPSTGNPAVDASTAHGKGIFDSQRCSGCHGANGGGGAGPALTHISNQYPPVQLTAVLKAPTAKMKAAGMVPLTLRAADMKALVSYVTGLGGASVASAAPASISVSSSPIVIPLELHISISAGVPTASVSSVSAPYQASKAASPKTRPASVTPSHTPAPAGPGATAGVSKPPTGNPAVDASTAHGKAIFDSQRCSGCHGANGGGGAGPALTHISNLYLPVQLTAILKAPTAKMKAAGMVPLTLSAADMKALVSYVTGLGGASADSGTTQPDSGSPSTASAKVEPKPAPGALPAQSRGRAIFEAHGCVNCHGTDGVAGTAAAPALAGNGASLGPALLTTMLRHPTDRMHQGGMPPVSLDDDELKALVTYLDHISNSRSNPR
jgi:ubiquinol-cytochrome c reductase cytochrome b subunit